MQIEALCSAPVLESGTVSASDCGSDFLVEEASTLPRPKVDFGRLKFPHIAGRDLVDCKGSTETR